MTVKNIHCKCTANAACKICSMRDAPCAAHVQAKANSAKLTVALTGNPNSGKTTLFNRLTGKSLRTGNRAGVTVANFSAAAPSNPDITVTDTPGVNALSPYSPEEKYTTDYLTKTPPDVIINVVDCTRPERSLYLTTQLLQTNRPVVVALTMADVAQKQNIAVNTEKLSQTLGVQCVTIDRSDKAAADKLLTACRKAAKGQNKKTDDSVLKNLPPLSDTGLAAATKRRAVATKITAAAFRRNTAETMSDKIDKVVVSRVLAFPIFAIVMWAIFFIATEGPCKTIADFISGTLTQQIQSAATNLLECANVPWLTSLISDGIIGGAMSVVGFLPQITVLAGLVSLLEESGYMARIAFITDLPLSAVGLCGQSAVCLTVGCGCSVPAVMAARTVKCEKLRRTTVSVVPYVPCSAKLAVIACVTSRIFDGNAFVALSLYAVCLAAVAVAASILNKTTDGNEASVEITELPDYRLPKLSVAGRQMLSAATGFLEKAGTTIVVTSVLLWGCRYFTPAFGKAFSEEDSICGVLGKIISPLFAPLGFDDGNCGYAYAVATIVGLSAKEAAVATLTVLGGGTLPAISPLGAYCWALYNLLTVPCIATVAASAAEQGRKNAAVAFILQAGLAYVFTLIARTIGLAVSSIAR